MATASLYFFRCASSSDFDGLGLFGIGLLGSENASTITRPVTPSLAMAFSPFGDITGSAANMSPEALAFEMAATASCGVAAPAPFVAWANNPAPAKHSEIRRTATTPDDDRECMSP